MLARTLLLTPLLLAVPVRELPQAGSPPESSSKAPGSGATDPALEQSEPRPAIENAPPLQASEWMQQVEREIERAEYDWSCAPDGAYDATNRSENLRSRIGPCGLEVLPREATEGAEMSWKLTLRTLSFGSEDDVRPLGESCVARSGNRIDVHYAAFSEWYVNDEHGIEQGWTILAPPTGRAGSSLRIEIETSGLRAEIAGDDLSALFVDDTAEMRLRYQGIRAWDATGRDLIARLLPARAGLAIHVEDEDALYPITVDPILSGPAWTAESDQADAHFGFSVSGAGDVNGDGFDDVIVGAYGFDNGQTDEGRAFLYLGSNGGPSLTPDWTAESDHDGARFGISVSGAGDVNGDGFDDVIVGADGTSRAFLYLGSAAGPSLAPDWTAQHGGIVSGAGDANGDGYDDVIVGAPFLSHGQQYEGGAFLYLGSAGGPSLTSDWMAESDQVYAYFGFDVSGVGDLNGDGFDDVIVGADQFSNGQYYEGRAFLYLGSAGGPSLAPDWWAESNQDFGYFGCSVSGAGDVNGDGFDDVIVGARGFDNGQTDEGRAFLFLGSIGGPSLAPDWTADSDQNGAAFGWSVSGAGDVNGDGFKDVIVGAPYSFHGRGGAFLYLGSAVGPSPTSDWTADSDNQYFTDFGESVSGAGDVDGDGFDDVIVGAPWFTSGQLKEGRAYVYRTCAPIGTTYCIATANSSGSPAEVSAWGSASSAAGNLAVTASPVPNNQPGIFFHGRNQTQSPFGNGFLCTAGDLVRGAVIQTSGSIATYRYNNSDPWHSLASHVGTTRNFQYWFRDYWAFGAGFNTSNAISIAILP